MFWPAFLAIAALGLIGVAVFAVTAPAALLDKLPLEGTGRKRLLIAAQPAVLVMLAAAAGTAVAETASSKSLIADIARGTALPDRWAVAMSLAMLAGMFLGAALYLIDRRAKAWWGNATDDDLIDAWRPGGVLPGITYGGISEEILMRWGVMGLVLWAGASLTGQAGDPGPILVALAIGLSSLVFAAGHLPAAMIGERRSARFVLRVLALNTLAGLLFGWLFWRWNVETAMAAHAGFHIGAAILVLLIRRDRIEAV